MHHNPTHKELLARVECIADQIKCKNISSNIVIFPVPIGGVPVAYLLQSFLPDSKIMYTLNNYVVPGKHYVIVDDIIDSGKTKSDYPGFPFYALYDKVNNEEDKKLGWITFPWEHQPNGEIETGEDNITRILQCIGENVEREGLVETPARVVKSWKELYSGYGQDVKEHFKIFDVKHDELVLIKDIELYSTCEHHMLPFVGKAHIAYIADGRVIGASKLARVLEVYSRRLQIQERLGDQVVTALMEHLKPKGAACIIEAKHFCMCSRGINKQNSTMVTSSMKGAFLENPAARAELMGLIK